MGWFGCKHSWRVLIKSFRKGQSLMEQVGSAGEIKVSEALARRLIELSVDRTTVVSVCDKCGEKDFTIVEGGSE